MRWDWVIKIYFAILSFSSSSGKTIQSISILEYLRQKEGVRGPFLVIAPLSTLRNWQREVVEWTDMNGIVYHGNSTARGIIEKHEWHYKNRKVNHSQFDSFISLHP